MSMSMFSESEGSGRFSKVRAKGHRHSSLSIHPYFGKVDPALATGAISLLSRAGETVLDPFCGSGTVLHDSVIQHRSAIGFDSSPLAAMVSTAKILGISDRERAELLSFVDSTVGEPRPSLFVGGADPQSLEFRAAPPEMPRVRSIDYWFNPNALRELSQLRWVLKRAESSLSPEANLLLTVAFSRIITPSSRQKGESTYKRIDKDDTPGRVLSMFARSVAYVIKAACSFNQELAQAGLPQPQTGRLYVSDARRVVEHGGVKVTIAVVDSRDDKAMTSYSSTASLIVTSPPYLMSWDYGLYHKFRFYWLGLDLDQYEETEIGRHLRRRDDDVPRYVSDMDSIFLSLSCVVTPGAHAVFVNAPSVVHGQEVDTNAILMECAERSGWRCISAEKTIGIPGPHHGMYASLTSRGASATGTAGKREHVLVFKRDQVIC